MTLGENLGQLLLEIAQTKIREGQPEAAIAFYTENLHGMTDDIVLQLLKNECVLITSEGDTSMKLSNSESQRSFNQKNITNWNEWITQKLKYMSELLNTLNNVEDEFVQTVHKDILDCNINEIVRKYYGDIDKIGIHNIAAKLIAGKQFANLYSNGENVWENLIMHVEDGVAEDYEKALYLIVKYGDNIRNLHKEYMVLANSYKFLTDNNIADRLPFFETQIEKVIITLDKYCDPNKGYYHPMCDPELFDYKEEINDDLLSTDIGKEYLRHKIVRKNIMDGYDAGWLAPDGRFYGENGPTSSLIHLRIAERLKPCDTNPDNKLEEEGWIKIHGDEAFGIFVGHKEPQEGFPYKYCPSETQMKLICDYADKFYNGKLYLHPKSIRQTEPVTTYKLRQMDEVQLHETFSI